MGIHLIAEILKLGFRPAFYRFAPLGFRLAPADAHPDCHTKANTEHKACHVTQIEDIPWRHRDITRNGMKLRRRHQDIVPPAQAEQQKTDSHEIDEQKPLGMLTKQHVGNEQTVIKIKNDAQ